MMLSSFNLIFTHHFFTFSVNTSAKMGNSCASRNVIIPIGTLPQPQPQPESSSSPILTYERLLNWGVSLEKLLKDDIGKKWLETFSRQEQSECNILFWLEVEKFKTEEEETDRLEKAKMIFQKFLVYHTELEISVSGETKFEIRKEMEQGLVTKNIFDVAQREIFTLIERDTFERFKLSDIYQKKLESYKAIHTNEPSEFFESR